MAIPHPKTHRYVNEEHLAWVNEHEVCTACTRPWPRGHHVISKGAGGGDEQVAGLCSQPDYPLYPPTCHHLVHSIGITTFQKRFDIDLHAVSMSTWIRSPYYEAGIWPDADALKAET